MYLMQRHAVIHILQGALNNHLNADHLTQSGAGGMHQSGHTIQIQRAHHAICACDIDDMDRLLRLGLGARASVLFAIQHIGSRNVVFA